jgi:1-acyl-sn-glycerol-3-phosphate acyltransferase
MARALGSVLFWSFLVLSSIALFPVALLLWAVTAPFDRQRRILHRFTCFWGSLYTWLNPAWRIEISGRENLRRSGPYVMVANHLSTLDILVLFRLFSHFKWVSKIENFRLPFIGWNMRLNRYIPLRRGNRPSAVQMMREAERQLAEGSSIMLFPEGTRSRTGRLRDFKIGAFELALRSQTPLLPIVIEGSGNALPKRGFVLRGRHRIRVRVLEPLPYETFQSLSAKELTDQVQRMFAERLGQSPA